MVMRLFPFLLVCGLAIGVAPCASAQAEKAEDAPKLKVGDKAPDFELPGAKEDEPKKLSDYEGEQNVLLAFYPKAFTPGCTKQLCGYRDDFSKFKSGDTAVVAISIDEQARSDEFKAEYELPFTVLGDAESKIIEAYGIPVRSRGTMEFAQRSVVLVDREGVIRYIDMDYSIADDQQPLFEAIDKLGSDDSAQ